MVRMNAIVKEKVVLPQENPNGWSCLPTAFACCLDVPVSEIFDWLGHDGSEILWPELPEPGCRYGFHIQEMQEYCLAIHRLRTVYLERVMRGTPDGKRIKYVESRIIDPEVCGQRGVLLTFDGLESHAVAWDGEYVFDGLIRKSLDFNYDAFCLI